MPLDAAVPITPTAVSQAAAAAPITPTAMAQAPVPAASPVKEGLVSHPYHFRFPLICFFYWPATTARRDSWAADISGTTSWATICFHLPAIGFHIRP